MGHRRHSRAYRGLFDAGSAGIAWGLLMVVSAGAVMVILIWLSYVLVMKLMSLM